MEIRVFQIGYFQMPTTRKQKSKGRESRESEMLSDLENMVIMLGNSDFEREHSEFGNSPGRPECPSYHALVDHDTNSHSNSGENEIRRFAGNGHISWEIDSSSEINMLSGELNQRITQKMNDLMSSVSSQIQRAISEAINEQVLPQIQAALGSGSSQMPQKGWNVMTERPEYRSEGNLNPKLEAAQEMSSPET